MVLGRCHTRANAVTTAYVKGPIRATLGLASLFALCSFLIAVFSLVAYRLNLVDIVKPLPDGPAVQPVTAFGVILLAVCVVLTMQRARPFVDAVCTIVLFGALAQLAFPERTGHWLQELNPFPAGPETVVSTSTSLCLLMLAVSLLLRQYRNAWSLKCCPYLPTERRRWHWSGSCSVCMSLMQRCR